MNNTKGNEGKIKKVLSFQDLSSTWWFNKINESGFVGLDCNNQLRNLDKNFRVSN